GPAAPRRSPASPGGRAGALRRGPRPDGCAHRRRERRPADPVAARALDRAQGDAGDLRGAAGPVRGGVTERLWLPPHQLASVRCHTLRGTGTALMGGEIAVSNARLAIARSLRVMRSRTSRET